MKVKRMFYFMEINDGTSRRLSEEDYMSKISEYEARSWDHDEFSRNFVNSPDFVQYENCTTFYLNDFSVTLGYCQREIY